MARNLTLDEAARMTKIRPQRLAEIEADDFSQFPSLAYAKGFLLIYGKFLDVDVTPYLDAFEDSESVTVDGYSYLQENERAKPVSAPVARRRPAATGGGGSNRVSPMPLIVGVVVLVIGFLGMKFFLNVQRLAPGREGVERAKRRQLRHRRLPQADRARQQLRTVAAVRYECAGRVACPDTRAAGNAQGVGC